LPPHRTSDILWDRNSQGVFVEITGLDHIYVAVSDFDRSEQFYDGVMAGFGFKKGVRPIAGERHAHYFNRVLQYTIRPSRGASRGTDPYAPGLHHFCFQVETRAEVDEAWRLLQGLKVAATQPSEYPEYNDDYYAIFFEDPDGVRLEVIARSRYRDQIRERWDELRTFVNPIADLESRE
jgi:glyoxylase I family protein